MSISKAVSTKADRIEEAMQYVHKATGTKVTWHSLTVALKKTPSASNRWKKNKISEETLKSIADYLNVSFVWLLTNNGSMLSVDHNSDGVNTNDDIQDAHFASSSILRSIGSTYVKWLEITESNIALNKQIQRLTEQLQALPSIETQAKIIDLQKIALGNQLKAQQLYVKLFDQGKQVIADGIA